MVEEACLCIINDAASGVVVVAAAAGQCHCRRLARSKILGMQLTPDLRQGPWSRLVGVDVV